MRKPVAISPTSSGQFSAAALCPRLARTFTTRSVRECVTGDVSGRTRSMPRNGQTRRADPVLARCGLGAENPRSGGIAACGPGLVPPPSPLRAVPSARGTSAAGGFLVAGVDGLPALRLPAVRLQGAQERLHHHRIELRARAPPQLPLGVA